MDIPHWTKVPDYFVWEAFHWASRDTGRIVDSDASQHELLLADTQNFYVIPDQFGVVSGHVLILPKQQPASSIATVDSSVDEELTWLLKRVSTMVAIEYGAQIVVAEHGECGCATASQAHIHVLPIPEAISSQQLRTIIDMTLRRRLVGIERITYRGTEFTALEDMQALIHIDGAEVSGRQLQCSDLANDCIYPAAARTASGLIRPYVYFNGPGIQFVSTCSFRSQFVREVVSIAISQPPGAWNRRVHTDRSNMFSTFKHLAGPLLQYNDAMYEFTPRGGRLSQR